MWKITFIESMYNVFKQVNLVFKKSFHIWCLYKYQNCQCNDMTDWCIYIMKDELHNWLIMLMGWLWTYSYLWLYTYVYVNKLINVLIHTNTVRSEQEKPDSWGRHSEALSNLGSGNLEGGGIGERVGKGEISLQATWDKAQ